MAIYLPQSINVAAVRLCLNREGYHSRYTIPSVPQSWHRLALLPGPTQLSVTCSTENWGAEVASSPGPTQKWEKGLVTLAYVQCQQFSFGVGKPHSSITNCYILDVKVVDTLQDQLKMGTRLADFCKPRLSGT